MPCSTSCCTSNSLRSPSSFVSNISNLSCSRESSESLPAIGDSGPRRRRGPKAQSPKPWPCRSKWRGTFTKLCAKFRSWCVAVESRQFYALLAGNGWANFWEAGCGSTAKTSSSPAEGNGEGNVVWEVFHAMVAGNGGRKFFESGATLQSMHWCKAKGKQQFGNWLTPFVGSKRWTCRPNDMCSKCVLLENDPKSAVWKWPPRPFWRDGRFGTYHLCLSRI